MKTLLALLPVLSLLILPLARGQTPADTSIPSIDPAKKAEIEKLLNEMGTLKVMQQSLDQMLASMKTRNPQISSEFWDRFQSEINVRELIDKMMPIYDKYYSLDDLKAVNAFYATPAGKRLLAVTPQIAHESMQMGEQWGRNLSLRIVSEMREEKAKNSSGDSAPGH
jgi:hypothetical protein